MAFNITATAAAVKAHLDNSSLFFAVDVHQPKSAVGEGPYACIYPESMRVVETTLTHPIELHVLRVRLFQVPWSQQEDDRVLDPSVLAGQVLALFYADFSLGANIRNVDVAGQYGEPLGAEFNLDEVLAETPYHVADITVPLIVDGDTAFVA